MVLNHIADDAGLFIGLAASLDAEILGECDLHVLDVMAIPDRLEKCVRKTKVEDVLNRFLAQVMIDAEDVGLGDVLVQGGVERSRRRQIAAERLLDDDA